MDVNTILIVEDDAGLVELLSERVESSGYHTFSAASACKAIDWLIGHPPFLMILDYSLPDMNGKELINELKERGLTVPPFIVSTGQGDERIAVEMMKLGARDYIIKDNHFLDMIPLVISKVSSLIENEIKLKVAELALIESNQFNKQIIKSAQEGIIVYGLDMKYQVWNPYMENLTGLAASEVLGKHPSELFPFLRAAGIIEIIERALHGEVINDCELPYYIPDSGKSGWASDTTSPLFNATGKIIGAITTVRDITDRRRAEDLIQVQRDLGIALSKTSTLEAGLKLCLEAAMEVSGMDCGGFYIVDPATRALNIAYHQGLPAEVIGSASHYEADSVNAQLVFAGKPIYSQHLSLGVDVDVIRKKEKLLAIAIIPIHHGGQVISCLNIASHTLNEVPVHVRNMLEVMSGQIGQVIARLRSVDALRENEKKYRYIFANNPQPMWIYDLETLAFLEVNDAAIHHYGYSRDEFMQMTLKDIRPAEDISLLFENIKMISSSQNSTDAWKHIKKNGEIIFVEITAHSVLFNGRNARHILINDITEKKLAERQLKLLGRAIDQSPVTVVITDKDGNIEYANPKFMELTGYSMEEVKGKNPRILKSENQPREFYEDLWKTILSGKDWTGEFHNKKKNGESYWESALISSITNSQGDITSFVAIKEDITDRKNMVGELIEAKEKAEESDRLKSAFLANMSHEIRTPMNGILGFTELLLDPDLDSEEKRSYIKLVHISGQRMLNTVNDIIEISKIESGMVSLNIEETKVNKMVLELTQFFVPEASAKGISLTIEKLLPEADSTILTDTQKLYSILNNLIKNAIKFTDQGSIRVGCSFKNNMLEFCISDTGIGIPWNRKEAIFDRFVQADVEDSRAFQGSGLGLSISKANVEMLGGTIWVDSEEAKGSTFHFTLPCYRGTNDNGQRKIISSSHHKVNRKSNIVSGLKILIAEDDEVSDMLISIMIEQYGREILKAATGVKAIEICQNNPDIDLILIDLKMPVMDGLEATHQIRKFDKKVIIVAQTAYGLAGDREKALEAGCNDYISKPISSAKLRELVQKYFGK